MNSCPACSSAAADGAEECANCGIIFKKAAALQARKLSEAARPMSAQDPVQAQGLPREGSPSKATNLAILAFMVVPLSAGVLSTLSLLGVGVNASGAVFMVPLAAAAIIVIACRLAIAPVAVPLLGLALVVGSSIAGRPAVPPGVDPSEVAHLPGGFALFGMHMLLMSTVATGLVWWDRESFVRSWEPSRFAEWTLHGLRNLLRPDAGAIWRVLGGFAVVLVFPMAVTFFASEDIRREIVTSSMRAPLKVLMMLGIGLMASGLRLE